MPRCLLGVLFVSSLCAASAVSVARAQVATILIEPEVPVTTLPIQAVVAGNLLGTPVLQARPAVFDGTDYRIELELGPDPFGAPAVEIPFFAKVDLPAPPDGGRYGVEVVGVLDDTEIPLGSTEVFVDTGATISIGSSFGGPFGERQVVAGEQPLAFAVEGIASCPALFDTLFIEGRTVVVPVARYCAILPPGPSPFRFELETPDALGPGTWRFEVRDAFGRAWGETELVVLEPTPRVGGGRFQVDVSWQDFGGNGGVGLPAQPPSDESTLFWFFAPDNQELTVKVLDGCGVNGHYWVFGAATTNVGYQILVTDTETGAEWTTFNPLGTLSPAIADVEAFPCDTGAAR
ncbi:MAG: hypothetical protein AAGC60_10565 [Acidobacteriota bacterium]